MHEHPRHEAVMIVAGSDALHPGGRMLVRCTASWWTSVGMGQVTKLGCYCDNSGISLVLSF